MVVSLNAGINAAVPNAPTTPTANVSLIYAVSPMKNHASSAAISGETA